MTTTVLTPDQERLVAIETRMRSLDPVGAAYWKLKPGRNALRAATDLRWRDEHDFGTRAGRWAPLPWPRDTKGRWRALRDRRQGHGAEPRPRASLGTQAALVTVAEAMMTVQTITTSIRNAPALTRAQLTDCIGDPAGRWGNLELAIRFQGLSMTLAWTGFTKDEPDQPQGFHAYLFTADDVLTTRRAQRSARHRVTLYDGGAEPFTVDAANLLTAEELIEVAWHFGTTGEPLVDAARRFEWIKTQVGAE